MPAPIYVWIWLPRDDAPVVCGALVESGHAFTFRYGRSYLERSNAVPIYGLALRDAPHPAPGGPTGLHPALRDSLPDAWGQHVIATRLLGRNRGDIDTAHIDLARYMLESGSQRFGALDFQASATRYVPRTTGSATLDDLAQAAHDLEAGLPIASAVEDAFEHGTSIGGARPKLTIADGDEHWIVKLSSSTDRRPVMKHETAALTFAQRCGIRVPHFERRSLLGRDALFVERFDRGAEGDRVMTVSALTVLGLDEMEARWANYVDFADVIVESNGQSSTRRELFTRVAFNIAVGNDDDHARNHAAFWDGRQLHLAPAYDLDPRRSAGWESNQAMAYGRNGERRSNLASLIGCHADYGLTRNEARGQVDRIIETIRANWLESADAAGLTQHEAELLRRRAILHPGALEGL